MLVIKKVIQLEKPVGQFGSGTKFPYFQKDLEIFDFFCIAKVALSMAFAVLNEASVINEIIRIRFCWL